MTPDSSTRVPFLGASIFRALGAGTAMPRSARAVGGEHATLSADRNSPFSVPLAATAKKPGQRAQLTFFAPAPESQVGRGGPTVHSGHPPHDVDHELFFRESTAARIAPLDLYVSVRLNGSGQALMITAPASTTVKP